MNRLGSLVLAGWAVIATVSAAPPNPPPFAVGEKLSYRLFWGPLPVGLASLEVEGIELVNNHPCYRVRATAQTTGLGGLLFEVNSSTESWIDTAGFFSRRFLQNRHEGHSRSNKITNYDYEHQQAVTRNFSNGHLTTASIPPGVQDIISAMYYIRTRPLTVNQEETFVLNTGDQNWTVTVCPDEREAMNLRPVGDVQALRLEPNPTLKIVSANNGRMWFWVTDDPRHLPLVLNSPMSIGTAKMVLYKVEQLHIAPASATNVAATATVPSP